jgi:hypothetical protein
MNNLAMATGGRVITNIDDVMAASKPKESGVPKNRCRRYARRR